MPPQLDKRILRKLEEVVGPEGVLVRPEHVLVYECDGTTAFKTPPAAVVLPRSTEDVARVVRICADAKIPFVGRGAGTGLSGGAIPIEGGVVVAMNRMNRILSVDAENRSARVETGIINLEISRGVAEHGLFFAPDPSSQSSCTVGGNIAENAGGPHCFKYGPTTAHILSLTVVLPDGEIIDLGQRRQGVGYDLVGLFIGSEGTFGIATAAEVRLLPLPEAVKTCLATFLSMVEACEAVSDIVALGIIPAAVEMMDRATIEVVEAGATAGGYPKDAEAVLLVEFDGSPAALNRLEKDVAAICRQRGAVAFVAARDAGEREKLWRGRKAAFGAMGRLSTDLYVQDGVVPRTRLPEVLAKVEEIGRKYRIRVANVFHAGDGNLHPCISYDGRDADEKKRVLEAGSEILKLCISVGGAISGEHGVGTEKSEYMSLSFSESDLDWMRSIRDIWNPEGLCNPGKLLPTGQGCGEKGLGSVASGGGAWI
jgi:glycolate oxidase subunit GlcD